jgi:hypothetical protein
MTRAENRPGSLEPAFATWNPAEFCAAVASVPDERRDDHPLTGAFGRSWFDVGEVLIPGTATEKEESIGHFKKGFTSRIEIRPDWRLARDLERDGTPAPEQA